MTKAAGGALSSQVMQNGEAQQSHITANGNSGHRTTNGHEDAEGFSFSSLSVTVGKAGSAVQLSDQPILGRFETEEADTPTLVSRLCSGCDR